jgi:hypothetical protein
MPQCAESLMNLINVDRLRALVRREQPNWSDEQIAAAINGYFEFLMLNRKRWGSSIAAPSDIDVVWHAHILDSVQYRKFCNEYFGGYLDHDPCIGAERDDLNVDRTLKMYTEDFGHEPGEIWLTMVTCAGPGAGCGSIHPDTGELAFATL